MNPIARTIAGAFAVVTLVACQQNVKPDANNPHYEIPVGSTFTLNRAVTIPPNTASTYIQAGETMRGNEVDEFNGYCELQVERVLEEPQPVTADSFRVTRVRRNIMEVSRPTVTRLAAVGMGIGLMAGDGPTQVFYSTEMLLHSDQQPQVRSLTCQWDQANSRSLLYADYMSISDMRSALGSLGSLEVPTLPE